mgnify:FL=1
MSKSNSIVTDINRLLMYCDDRFRTRNVSVLECLEALEADARQFCMSKQQILDQVATAKVASKVSSYVSSQAIVY